MLVLQAAYNSTLNRPPCPQSRTWCIRSLPGREVPTHIPTQLANQERKHGLGQAEAPSQHDSDPALLRFRGTPPYQAASCNPSQP